jgi:SAM-dependent methyltransferase
MRRVTVWRMTGEPAFWGLRRRALDLLDTIHLARPAVRAYELLLAARSHLPHGEVASDGLPVPPARLRAQIGPRHADAEYFLRSGEEQAELVMTLVRDDGADVAELDAILDWGCGCGRVLRNWKALTRTRVVGCDINPTMISWCGVNLPFADVAVNELSPPLPFDDSSFDLVYAFSVLTHLSVPLQEAWMHDCFRVLRPGGRFVFSTMGDHYLTLGRLNEAERREFERGNVVVLYDESSGTSLCSAYHPAEYVRTTLAADFEVKSLRPASDFGRHDVYLVQKPE